MENKIADLFVFNDTQGESVIIELVHVDLQATNLSDTLKDCANILTEAYVPVEKQFVKQFPEAIIHDKFLNALEPFFRKGINDVDLDLVEEKIRSVLMGLFAEGFAKSVSVNKDASAKYEHLIVVARNKVTNSPLGMIYFFIAKEDPQNSVRVPIFGIAPNSQNRGLGKLLMSSILHKFPNTQKILLSTRVSNDTALNAYRAWGFTQVQSTMEYWVNMEYEMEKSNILQEIAKKMR